MKKGDVVLVPFPFSDLSGNKIRPAVVLIDSTSEVTVAFVSTQVHKMTEFDFELAPDSTNGLKHLSYLRLNKIVTIHSRLIFGRLGNVDQNTLRKIDTNLIAIFKIQIAI
ncbi:MAG: type II toxin-antitoxin system PemK/MazF family toxin [Chitinophagales bacterium]